MIEIIPAIIPKSLEEIQEKMERVEGLVKKVQIDFVDGKYAPTLTWPFNNMAGFEGKLPLAEKFIIQADLMIHNPENFVPGFIAMGAREFIIHLDSTDRLEKCVQIAKRSDCKVGLGVKPSLSLPRENTIHQFDFIQFMGSDRVGYNGVELDRRVFEKIYRFHADYPSVQIQVDIGVSEKTASEFRRAGVSGLVSGSAVFNKKDIKKNIENLNVSANTPI